MAVFSADAAQTIPANGVAVFTTVVEPSNDDSVKFRPGTGAIVLSGFVPCRCRRKGPEYSLDFGANIAVATGGTAEAISVAISLDGAAIPASEMIVTPAAVEEYFNVSRDLNFNVVPGCCDTVTVQNLSSHPILMQNATIKVNRVVGR